MDQFWVLAHDGREYGPAYLPTLIQWVREGRVSALSTVRRGTGYPQEARAIPEIAALFAAGPAGGFGAASGGAGGYGPAAPGSLGGVIHEGHAAEQVKDADVVVVSSAVRPDNPEVLAAQRASIPVIPDYKTAFQELSQERLKTLPEYRVLSEAGPDHRKEFTVELLFKGAVYGRCTGKSKKEAEQKAAKEALEKLSSSV